MKKTLTLILALILVIGSTIAQPFEIWVSPDGNDSNPGTEKEPLATINMAQRKAREMRRLHKQGIENGIDIVLKEGTYKLEEPILIRPEDSGTKESPTVFKADEFAKPVISGGVKIEGWKKYEGEIKNLPKEAKGNIYVADIPIVGGHRLAFRQLWINDTKAARASNLDDGELDRIISSDTLKQELGIPLPGFNYSEIAQLELVIHQWWAIANLRVKNIKTDGDKAYVSFYQPESRIEFEHPWPAPFIDAEGIFNGNSAFYFVNAIALLNNPGEWYADESTGKIYYWPRKGEDLSTANAIVPNLKTLVEVKGSLDSPVSNIIFTGIDFQHTTWMRPSEKGHVPLQAGMYLYDAYKLWEPGTPDKSTLENQAWVGRPSAAVSVYGASNIEFYRCNFSHIAATGLDFLNGTKRNIVEGCAFYDIGGSAIQAGFFGNKDFEAHLPYNPTDNRDVCQFLTIRNNIITNATNEDWGCVGICVGYAHDITIEHNEISHINYSGISLGWGWTRTISCMKNNKIHANYIHNFAQNMFDVGGVYTLSSQPNTVISENRIERLLKAPYAHIPEHFQYIYYDEASSYIRSVNNWTEKGIFFENNPGPGNQWINNGPHVADSIKTKAGLESDYTDLQDIYKKECLKNILEQDAKQKSIEFNEEYDFMEEGRGPR